MSRVEIPMPQMGESIAEGTLSVWLKRVGDTVERDEPIMEISTDKVDAEIPSPAAGVLAEVMVEEGKTVPVGTVVGYVETDPNELVQASGTASQESGIGSDVRDARVAAVADVSARPAGPMLNHSENGEAKARTDAGATHEGASSEEIRLRLHPSPLVRRMIEEHGLQLTAIRGTGRAGRVTKADVLRHLDDRGSPGETSHSPSAAAPASPDEAGSQGRTFGWDEFYHEVVHPKVPRWDGDRVEPMSRMTSLIADHMVLSRRTAAHVHSYFEIDYTRVDQVREQNRELWAEQDVRVNYTAFVAVATAQALREFPQLNAAISGNEVIYRGVVNLGIAVALGWGLIVPVIRNADQLSLVGMATSIQDLATRAREKRLAPEEVQEGTFTITNPGVFGTLVGFPILNQPQVGILGIGAVEKRAVVVADEFGNDAIVARRRGYLSLGFDHRLVNGADADRFTGRIKQILEAIQE